LVERYLDRSSNSGIHLVGSFVDGGELLTQLNEVMPDVVLLDLDARGGTQPLVFANRLRALGLPIGVVAMIGDRTDLAALQTAPGLSGPNVVLLSAYQSSPPMLVLALENALRNRHEAAHLGSRTDAPTAAREVSQLPSRKRQVLALVAQGCSNAAIAEALGISVRSVESHLAAVYRQLSINASADWHARVLAARQYYGLR
jgi:DNA-binding NarL/FixJ family response regulator